jgi:chemotaxis regulatin CheY-phosphate phosphatase CheZ
LAVEALKHAKIAPITVTDDKGIFDVLCSLPTISDEFNLENQLRKNNNQIDINNESELRETIGNVFINELVKYIKVINIHDLEAGTTIEIDLKNIDVKSRIQILGQLPSLVIKKVIDYIGTVNKEIEQILLFKYNLNGKVIEERLKIDASFFTLS